MTLLRINDQTIDDVLRHLRRNPSDAHAFEPASISLGAAVELAFCTPKTNVHPTLQRWKKKNRFLKQAVEIVGGAFVEPPAKLYEPQDAEFFSIRRKCDVTSDSWNRFLERFSASLRKAGFGKLSHAIAGAFDEMAGNITQHSTYRHPALSINGLAAYSVAEKTMSLAIGDAGIGALASLRFNPQWRSLPNSREAVRAIAQEHASRRIGQGKGKVIARFLKL